MAPHTYYRRQFKLLNLFYTLTVSASIFISDKRYKVLHYFNNFNTYFMRWELNLVIEISQHAYFKYFIQYKKIYSTLPLDKYHSVKSTNVGTKAKKDAIHK